jgi:hypothetical protein
MNWLASAKEILIPVIEIGIAAPLTAIAATTTWYAFSQRSTHKKSHKLRNTPTDSLAGPAS